jgi:hypothetical protein
VNGRYLSGAKPFEEFAKAINAELGRLNLPVPAGAPAGSCGSSERPRDRPRLR